MNSIFDLKMQVRDYECDIQGIVNNAVYQNYLEHARHQFLKSMGLDFAELHSRDIDAVVIKTVLNYKYSLFPGDEFVAQLSLEKQGRLKFVFHQSIYLPRTEQTCLMAETTCVLISNGKPIIPTVLDNALEQFISLQK